MTTRDRPHLLTLACLGTALLLTACSSPSPEAGRPNTAPPSPVPSSSAPTTNGTGTPPGAPPTGTPTRPATAEGLTLAAAETFVRYYVDLLNYASATGDIQPVLSASESGCRHCKDYTNYVKQVNAANGGLSGDYLERVKDVPDLFRGESGRLGGYALVTIGVYTSKDSPSAKPVTSKVRTYKREFTLSPQRGSWVMYEMELVAQ